MEVHNEKSSFVALILGTIGIIFFALGMCMCLISEWNMFNKGIVAGIIGLVVLLVMVIVWRKMEGKEPIRVKAKTIGTVVIAVLGALILGIGMCLTMVFNHLVLGIVIGLIGIIVLLTLIPLTKGIHD